MLIGRFVSIFVGAEFKFKKQKFNRREGEPRPQVEWQCVVLRVDLTRNGSHLQQHRDGGSVDGTRPSHQRGGGG